ncbi:glycoside hydrolase family 16 protein [Aliifodinibius sp. S!AR15-10]|uniref:glycoside hydrolase family 16 protein n=1 Tax=Aliifodinibius sp. S!AR15-10 TaxID=2950437 RepID=UPI00285E25DE|nr:glycoside hydrolase family 16 protein [Aliifodinibius sp. S!AR15-10]MDR8393990.1 glycoside hydrolase family 16 protein [Aliifodinibius sp. S!AR15-10]
MISRGWIIVLILASVACSQDEQSPYETDNSPDQIEGYELVWHDEFNQGQKPDPSNWSYEYGFVRNQELQWYQQDNARIEDGRLVIEGRREQVKNEFYDSTSTEWREERRFAEYTSSSINTRGNQAFQYGLVEVRARIDTARGMWPAIWMLGTHPERGWPANGEIDIMEYYRIEGEPHILANAAWSDGDYSPIWDDAKIPFEKFLEKDPEWPEKYHIWKMDWTEDYIKLYLDGELLNEIDLSETLNPDGFNPFHQPHYILLNLALGSNGGDPSDTSFPKQYEVDYVRVYQKM